MKATLVTLCLLLYVLSASAQAAVAKSQSQQTASTQAQSATSQIQPVTTNVVTVKQEKPKTTTISADITYVSNLKTDTDAEKDRSTAFGITLTHELNSKLTLRVIGGIDQSLVADTKTSVTNTQISLAFAPISLKPTLDLKSTLFGILPTNEDDRRDATLQGGTGGALSLGQKTAFFGKSTTVNYGLSALKNYHEFTRSSSLGANISHRIRYQISTSTKLNEKLSLILSSYYQTGWTYDDVLRTNFFLKEGLAYSISENAEISISHVNAANALRPNGVDSNVSVYDKNTSAIEVGISATY